MKLNRYYFFALLSYFLWGFFSLALKPIAHESSLDILFFRILLSVGIIVIIAVTLKRDTMKIALKRFRNFTTKEKKQALGWNLLGGGLLGFNWFLFIYVVNQVNVQTASYAYLICPIITSMLSFVLLRENASWAQLIAMLLCLVGCTLYYISDPNNLLFAFLIALSYALFLISQKKNQFFDKFTTLIIQLITVFILAVPYYIFKGFNFPTDVAFYLFTGIIALFFTIVPLYMNLYALQGVAASTVGILIYINPIISFLLSVYYFNEPIHWLQILAYILIAISIVVFNIKTLMKVGM